MASRVKFVKGATQSAFLNLLGVSYGVLIAHGEEWPIIVDLNCARLELRLGEAGGIFTSEEVQTIEKAMVEVGLESITAMINKARRFPIPGNYSPLVHFKACAEPNCWHALAHGSIFDSDGQLQTLGHEGKELIDTLADGFDPCEYIARNGGEHKLDAITLFQQMLAADLAFDERDWAVRYYSLPEEERDKYKKDSEKN